MGFTQKFEFFRYFHFILGDAGSENVFGEDIDGTLDWSLEDNENIEDLESIKICIFPKRLGHGFGQKCKFFYPFKFDEIGQESVWWLAR